MELSLGRRADYAIRVGVDLARHHGDGRRKARQNGEEMAIPTSFLPQILDQLAGTTFVALAAIDVQLEDGSYVVPDDVRAVDPAIGGSTARGGVDG